MLPALQMILVMVFPALVTVGGLRDLTSYIIPNWISITLAAAFLPAALALGVPLGDIGLHAAVGAGALVAGMVMFALGWIGGGDAKLFAAAGLWLGWPACLIFIAATAVAGGALALSLLMLRSIWLRPFLPGGPAWFGRLVEPGENVPYGVAIAIGALAALPYSTLPNLMAVAF
ncbi:prepilin peptidase [Phenylobacterium sp.]|uniref:A24 family peptidase n=1 Tax=Phenylobacterium sp. TaxID=1871053 RepID=UPI0027342DC5|nr:prepilin peptidase [Phenylobacterium sp.]MDP3660708.1 prepilin peptidase [Phenylobacterium sp.]